MLMGEALVVGAYGLSARPARQTIGYAQRAHAAVITMLHPGRRAPNAGSVASLKKVADRLGDQFLWYVVMYTRGQ